MDRTTVNTLRPRQHGRHFADDSFRCISLNDNVWISIKTSLKFVPRGSIDNNPTLFQIMAWRRTGDKPLSETMLVLLLTHICVTRPQWVMFSQAYHLSSTRLVTINENFKYRSLSTFWTVSVTLVDLTHWSRVMHICVGNLTTIGSDNCLSSGRREATIWINAGTLSIRHLGTNFSEILFEIHIFSFRKTHLKRSSAKCRSFCLGLNVLKSFIGRFHFVLWISLVIV